MALVNSIENDLGHVAKAFNLLNSSDNKHYGLADVEGEKGTLIVFICNHCPYVIHIIKELAQMANDYKTKGIGVAFISSNDSVNYPADSFENMSLFAQKNAFDFPYLFDETQDVARQYNAMCTPDFYLYDNNNVCVYRGRFDESRPGGAVPTGNDLDSALSNLLLGKHSLNQIPSMGCSIKWK